MVDFDEAVKKFGLIDQTTPSSSQGQSSDSSGQINYDDAVAKFGLNETPESKTVKLVSPAEAPYEQKIQKYSESAKKQVEEEGATGAFLHGLGNVPLVGPAVQAGKRYYQAATGQGEGADFNERLENLKAKREAYNREVTAQHPYAEMAGELTQAVPMVFIPGVGWAAGAARAAAVPKYGRLAGTAAELAGWGAEGAGWGAATAAGEQAFGTKQPSEQKSIPEAAEEGAMFGAGLAAAGKTIGGIFSKIAPDWLAGFSNKDKHAANTFMEKMSIDHANGDLSADPKEFAKRIANGEPLSWFDIRGPETDRWIQQKFKNHPDDLENFKSILNQRLADAPERTQNFLKQMAGVEGNFDVDSVRKQARAHAEQQNAVNFREAYDPDNGRGSWFGGWNKALSENPDVAKAVDSISDTMSTVKGGKFENPFGNRGEMGLEEAGLDKATIQTLNDYGINNLYDLKRMSKEDVANAWGLGEGAISDTGRPPDVSNIYNSLKEPIKGMDLNERVLLRPDNVNIEFLDNLQQKLDDTANRLGKGASTSSEKTYVNQLKSLSADIRESLINEEHPSGLYNESFAKAHTQREMAHLKDDALTAGENFLKRINDRSYIDRASNEAANMSDEEKAFFKYGLLAQIEHAGITGGGVQTGAPQNVALAYRKIKDWFAKDNVKRGLENILGEKGYHDLQNHLQAEVFYKDAYTRARDLGARGDTFYQFLKNSWVPGLGGFVEYMTHGTPYFPVSIIMAKTANYYYGGNYARALADQLLSKNPTELTAAYDKFFNNKKLYNAVSNQLAAMAYAASVQAGETKYDSKKINQFTQNLDEYQKKAVDQAILQGMNLYKTGKNVTDAASQALGFNKGGRVGYKYGGEPYDWRQHYTPKPDFSDIVAPRHISERGVGIAGWHGSPYDFDKFSDKNLLSGEGRSAFGPPSHYIAQRRDIAESYRDKLTPKGKEGKLYQVKVAAHPDNFIDWHAPWAEQHPEVVSGVKSALRKLGVKGMSPSEMKRGYITGEDLYNQLANQDIDPNDIKKALMDEGIKGMKYFDAYSRKRALTFNPYYGKKLGGSRNFTVFDPNDIYVMNKYAQGGHVDVWHKAHRIHRKLGGQLTAPVNPAESARQQRMIESGLTNPVYHGTMANFNEFGKSSTPEMSLLLGTHVAKDPNISNTFTDLHGRVPINDIKWGNWKGKIPNVMPLMTHDDSKFLTVEQPERNGYIRDDDRAVHTEVLEHLMRKHPEFAHERIENSRGLSPEDAKKVYDKLIANKYYPEDKEILYPKNIWYPKNHLKSFIADYSIMAPFDRERKFADIYRRDMLAKGYKGLKYINTATHETEHAKDPTSYIVFHPEEDNTDWHPLRSKFAKFDPAKKSSTDIRESRGGYIKRATGGRIPEADKLFKDAKKYIDERTKGLLDQPDEKIVHALRIAKARNG